MYSRGFTWFVKWKVAAVIIMNKSGEDPFASFLYSCKFIRSRVEWASAQLLTFDLRYECPCSRQGLQGIEKRIFVDDPSQDPQGFSKAFMGNWPPGIQLICKGEKDLFCGVGQETGKWPRQCRSRKRLHLLNLCSSGCDKRLGWGRMRW